MVQPGQQDQRSIEPRALTAGTQATQFSVPNGDRRQLHPDLAGLFDGTRSRYAYQVEGLHEVLLEHFGDEYLKEQADVEFLLSEEEPRTPGRDHRN
jgi:hypothetical protein